MPLLKSEITTSKSPVLFFCSSMFRILCKNRGGKPIGEIGFEEKSVKTPAS
jgi:hypothetical protein